VYKSNGKLSYTTLYHKKALKKIVHVSKMSDHTKFQEPMLKCWCHSHLRNLYGCYFGIIDDRNL